MTKTQFNAYLEDYDLAGLSTDEQNRLRLLYASYPVPELVISSDLPRALETAHLFARGAEVIVDPLFREIPVKVPEASTWFLDRRWPSEMWWSYLRSAWFFNIPPEGQTLSYARCRDAMEEIMRYQQRAQRMAVVSHSGFLLVTVHLLMKARRLSGRRLPRISFGEPTTYRWR